MSSWSWLYFISLQKGQGLVFMLFHPKFVISFVQSFLWRNIMRTMISWARIIITQTFSIIVKIYLFPNADLMLFKFFFLCILLFDRFFKTVCAYAWSFSIFLFHLNSFQIGVLHQFLVNFVFDCHLFEFVEVPLILCAMYMCGGNALGHFKLVIHIESSLCDILRVFFTFFL